MTRDPLHLTKKEAIRSYNLMKALLKWIEQERASLHHIAEDMGKMPPLQRESDAVGRIEKIVAVRQKKLIEALQHLKQAAQATEVGGRVHLGCLQHLREGAAHRQPRRDLQPLQPQVPFCLHLAHVHVREV